MNGAGVPRFPTVTVTMATDGSGHLNSAGTHVDYTAGDPAATRAAVIQHAAVIATGLHRPVRMTVHDAGTVWLLAVAPDGTVTQLEVPVVKKGRPTPTAEPVPAAPLPPEPRAIEPPRPVAPAPRQTNPWAAPATREAPLAGPRAAGIEEATVFVPRSQKTIAQQAISIRVDDEGPFPIRSTMLVGRNPVLAEGETVESVVRLTDPGKTTSKTHLFLERRGDRLWVTDRGSANGTRLARAAGDRQQLTAGTPYELVDGDSLYLGGQTLTVKFAAT